MNDAELSRRLRRPQHQVRNQRRAFKIPAFLRRSAGRRWTVAETRLLGTMPDKELARRLKRTLPALQSRRHILGIPYLNPTFKRWKPEEDKLLGRFSDEEVARRANRPLNSVKTRRQYLRIVNPAPRHVAAADLEIQRN